MQSVVDTVSSALGSNRTSQEENFAEARRGEINPPVVSDDGQYEVRFYIRRAVMVPTEHFRRPTIAWGSSIRTLSVFLFPCSQHHSLRFKKLFLPHSNLLASVSAPTAVEQGMRGNPGAANAGEVGEANSGDPVSLEAQKPST